MLAQTNPSYLTSLSLCFRLQTALCDFQTSTYKDKMNCEFVNRLIEQIIAGIMYPEVQRDLFAQNWTLTLGKASQISKKSWGIDEPHEAAIIHTKCQWPYYYFCRHLTENHVVNEIQEKLRACNKSQACIKCKF